MKSRPNISVLLPDEEMLRARRETLVSEVKPRGPRRRGPVRVRRTLIAIAALLVLGGGAALAAGVFSADEIALDSGVGCYSRPSLDAVVTVTRVAADPVAKCARYWREGVIDADAPPGTAPDLVACADEGEPVRVFPGAGAAVCHRLGLDALPTDYASVGRARARAYAAFYSLEGIPTPGSSCPSPRAQANFARATLGGKYKDVDVVIEGDEPCGGGYELAGGHIAVVTVPRDRAEANRRHIARRRALGRVQAAVLPVFGSPPRYRRTRASCLAPEQFAGEVRQTLANAGFAGVEVGIERLSDPPPGTEVKIESAHKCVSLAARYNTCCMTTGRGYRGRYLATVYTMTRAEWKAQKASDRYWKARRSAAAPGGSN